MNEEGGKMRMSKGNWHMIKESNLTTHHNQTCHSKCRTGREQHESTYQNEQLQAITIRRAHFLWQVNLGRQRHRCRILYCKVKSRWLDQATIWICLIPLCIKPWHSDNCFFLIIIFFSLGVVTALSCVLASLEAGNESLVLSYLNSGSALGIRPERDGARGWRSRKTTKICQDPGQDPKGPRQMPITKKAKRRNYGAYVYTHGTRCHLLPYLVTAWDLQPTRKRAVHTTCSAGQENKLLRSMYCTIHELQSLVVTIHTVRRGGR